MRLKIGLMALALCMILPAAAADHTLEHEVESYDSRNLTYNISSAGSPAQLGEDANDYVGFTGLGILAIVWIVFYSIPNRKGYPAPDCMISANFVTTGISLLIFPMGWIQGEAVAFMIVALGGSLAYSRMQG
jgi:hypothetical protein